MLYQKYENVFPARVEIKRERENRLEHPGLAYVKKKAEAHTYVFAFTAVLLYRLNLNY